MIYYIGMFRDEFEYLIADKNAPLESISVAFADYIGWKDRDVIDEVLVYDGTSQMMFNIYRFVPSEWMLLNVRVADRTDVVGWRINLEERDPDEI